MIREVSSAFASVALSLILFLAACHDIESFPANRNGAVMKMRTYYMGRFALDVPQDMLQAVQHSKIRHATVDDFIWPAGTEKDKAREMYWEGRIAEIIKMRPPHNKKDVVIRLHEPMLGQWAKGIYFYGNYMKDRVANLDILVDFGKQGLWIKCDSAIWTPENEIKIARNVDKIATSYTSHDACVDRRDGSCFFLRHGALTLPYRRQEKTYARFEDHRLNLKLEVEMKETYQVEDLGVAERLAAALATRYAPGVDVNVIRSRNRKAAGLDGEELVMRMSASGEDTQIQFGWEYRGRVDSGEHPEIQITMETGDGSLDEKLKIWDAILDSFKPMYR